MKIKGVSEEQIKSIAAELGFRCDNPRTEGRYFLFVLRMAGSRMDVCGEEFTIPHQVTYHCTRKVHKDGQHIARMTDSTKKILKKWDMAPGWVHPAYRYRKKGYHSIFNGSDAHGGNGAVCFHGHKRFMEKIFSVNPEAVIRTKMAAYLGLESFKAQFPKVGAQNAGSAYMPVRYDEMCDCDPSDEREVAFGTLTKDEGVTNVRMIRQGDLKRCPFVIFSAEHYREDGTCKCDDPEHRKFMIKNWEYTEEAFKDIPLRKESK